MSWTFGEIRVKYRDKSWNAYQSVNPIIMIKKQTQNFSSKIIIYIRNIHKRQRDVCDTIVTCVTQCNFSSLNLIFLFRYKLKSVASRSMRGPVVDIVQHFQKIKKLEKKSIFKKKIKIQNI